MFIAEQFAPVLKNTSVNMGLTDLEGFLSGTVAAPDGERPEEWVELASETRTTIQSYITNMIDPFLMKPYNTVFSGCSTMKISEMIADGKILYVYMPIADKEAMSKVICTFVKLEYFREVLKNPHKTRPSILDRERLLRRYRDGLQQLLAAWLDEGKKTANAATPEHVG